MPKIILISDERGDREIEVLTDDDVEVATERYQKVLSDDEKLKQMIKKGSSAQEIKGQIGKMIND